MRHLSLSKKPRNVRDLGANSSGISRLISGAIFNLMEYYLGNFCTAILQKKFPKMYDVFREHNMKITYKKFPKGD